MTAPRKAHFAHALTPPMALLAATPAEATAPIVIGAADRATLHASAMLPLMTGVPQFTAKPAATVMPAVAKDAAELKHAIDSRSESGSHALVTNP
jgi:hypothetical protein